MAKGQQRKNKETKKPKQSKEVVVPAGFIIPSNRACHRRTNIDHVNVQRDWSKPIPLLCITAVTI